MKETRLPYKGKCNQFPMCLVMSLLLGVTGCFSTDPFEEVGVFEAPGRKAYVGDAVYGYSPKDDTCSLMQYRLTADQLSLHADIHDNFFATNFNSSCKLLDTLETNLMSFALHEKSLVVVKGAFSSETDARGKLGRQPYMFFAAVYDETPPEKAIAFLIPANEEEYEPLATYAFPLIDVDQHPVTVFSKIKCNDVIRKEFSPRLWKWNSEDDAKMNRIDVKAPASGEPVLALIGDKIKAISPEEVDKIDRDKHAVLKVVVGPNQLHYSKDGKIKYSSGLRGGMERWHYERGPDEGPYWLYLDDDYIRMHKFGCQKFEKGRGRHCQLMNGGQFAECCGGAAYYFEQKQLQKRRDVPAK